MPIPSETAVATNYNWVNSLDLVKGLHKPEISEQVTARYGSQNLKNLDNLE